MKALLIAALVAGSLPAFAATDFDQAPATSAAQEAVDEGLIPADQLDSSAYQAEALPPRRRPTRPMPPRRPHRGEWQCVARDHIQRSFRGDDEDLSDARREAMRSCERHSFVRGCRLVGCSHR
jgi:hypothetical protein